MSLVKELVVFLKGDTKDFNSKIDQAKGSLSGLSDSVFSLQTKIGVAFTAIGAGITGFMGLCLKAAGDSEKNISQLNTVLQSTGSVSGMTADSAIKLAESLQSVTTYTKGSIVGAENLLLTFTNIGKDVFPQATEEVLNMSTALGQDLKSSSIQLGKALNDPIKGVTALQRVGVSFTEQQKQQIKTLVESGHTMDAQKLILKELETEFGGQAKAAAQTFEGKIINLKNTFMSLKTTIGNAILPMFDELVARIKPIIEEFTKWVKSHQDFIKMAAPVVTILGLLSTVIGSLILILPTLISGVTAFGGVLSACFLPVTIAIAVLGGLYAAWRNNFLGIRDIVFKVWNYVLGVLESWKSYIPAITNYLVGVWDAFKSKCVAIWNELKAAFDDWYQTNQDTINQFVATLSQVFGPLWDWIKQTFIDAWSAMTGAVGQDAPYIQKIINNIFLFIVALVTWFMEFWNAHWQTIRDVLFTTWNAISSVVSAAWTMISETVKFGLQVLSGDWSGAWGKIEKVFSNVWDGIKNALSNAIEYMKNLWGGFTKWMENGIESLLSKIPGAQSLTDLAGWVGSKMPSFASGGVMPYDGTALVGEYGPELVNLKGGSRVFNNSETNSILNNSKATNNFHVTINTNGPVDAEEIARAIGNHFNSKNLRIA